MRREWLRGKMLRMESVAVLVLSSFILLFATAAFSQGEGKRGVLSLVPIGNVDEGVLHKLCSSLDAFGFECRIEACRDIPAQSFNPRRGQYYSVDILDALAEKFPRGSERVLGVTDYDLYVPRLTFVFGQASAYGRVAVISLCRLRQGLYGLPADSELFEKRAITEAVHELGHTYGLGHCDNSRCVMFFSNRLSDTDAKGFQFCGRCAQRFEESLR